ncbi:hyaluronan synthase 2 [Stachybotrys elegans]|uniref:Hyaluronan synthase 2 n=1 Tax=Stachybotrys elegans TaxID=80388 RepID=A0A8K0SKL9_9HYPO|nr:hyaluronan synthase 2 [Stachybotrys elegans]
MSSLSPPESLSTSSRSVPIDPKSVFNVPTRKPLKVNPFIATINLTVSFGLIGALIAGYGIGLSVFDFDITSVGLYGTILVSEYLVQLICAMINLVNVNRIIDNLAKRRANALESGDYEGACGSETVHTVLNPDGDVSMVVVGYREDERAWRECLRSLQRQTLRSKCIVCVIDGNEEPDLSMADSFVSEFRSFDAPRIDLPILLSDVHRETYFSNLPYDPRSYGVKVRHWLTGRFRPGHEQALALSRQAVIDQVHMWHESWNIGSRRAVCFTQPHSHKRTAMFTAFAISLYALRTRDAVLTTDSDTLVQPNGLDEMLSLLQSAPDIGGVTADVEIWNRTESLLTRLCAARYWFAFNIERACQSLWRCVGCLSGPMSMYRSCDLDTIIGPWNLQTFGGKKTTFGDDRHLTNQLLGRGLRTRYTHRTWCDSESPTTFVRWVSQQTRWSKSFFREVFWFPMSFLYQTPWLLVETTIQALYPFILIATVFHFLFDATSGSPWRPIIWLVTLFGIALFKSILAVFIGRDPWLLIFSVYGIIYFFGLLPSKVYAVLTMRQTGWGTSARSSAERGRGQSFLQRSFQVCHLAVWYTAVCFGIGFFIYRLFGNSLYFLIGVFALLPSMFLYWQGSISLSRFKPKIRGLYRHQPEQKSSPDVPIRDSCHHLTLPLNQKAPQRGLDISTTTEPGVNEKESEDSEQNGPTTIKRPPKALMAP